MILLFLPATDDPPPDDETDDVDVPEVPDVPDELAAPPVELAEFVLFVAFEFVPDEMLFAALLTNF